MKIVYLILLLLFYISLMLLKKTNKKENLILWLALNILVILAYHIFITFVFHLIHVKCTILNLSLVIIPLTIVISIKIIKMKEIQEYKINKQDCLFAVILFIVMFIFTLVHFKIPFEFKYNIGDIGIHYLAAMDFYDYSNLLADENSETISFAVNAETFMTGAYVNVGILFKAFSDVISSINFYYIFIAFDLSMLYLFGILFYSLITDEKNMNKLKYIIAYLVALICLCGYIITIVIYGFQYFLLGLNFILGIIIAYKKYKEENIKLMVILFLLNLGLFFSYYFFVPIVYGAIFIDYIKDKKKQIFLVENLTKLLYILILPACLGMYYFVIRPFVLGLEIPVVALGVDGDNYSSGILDFIIFAPLACYYLGYYFKRKEFDITYILFILELIFVAVLYVGTKLSIVSSYYFSKSLYLLWILLIFINFKMICNLLDKKKKVLKIAIPTAIVIYIVMAICAGIFDNSLLSFKIYRENYNLIMREDYSDITFSKEEMILMQKIKETINNTDTILFIPTKNELKTIFAYGFTKNQGILFSRFLENGEVSIQDWISSEDYNYADYFVYFNYDYEEFEPENDSKYYTIIYVNDGGGILKKK